MQTIAERNKAVVRRFNEECIARGDEAVLRELLHPDFVNRTAAPGVDPGAEGMRHTIQEVLHRALSDIRVVIEDQLAEGDRVASRKRILARHTGELLGAPPTGRSVEVVVFDIVRLDDGRYVEHWGLNTLPLLATQLRGAGSSR
jgi:predicted ester cyclase